MKKDTPPDNTGIPEWRCMKHGGHNQSTSSIPEGIDFSTQRCSVCRIKRTEHNANGCMAWCCCVCDKCSEQREKDEERYRLDDLKRKEKELEQLKEKEMKNV